MEVLIDRKYKKKAYTIGIVSIDGVQFCNSMEDTDRGLQQWMSVAEIAEKKIAGETAIPAGKYKVTMTYSPKYKRDMPQIMNVKGFSGIRIHSGNSAKDSLGCVLFGKNDLVGWISNSRATCEKFEQLLKAAGGSCDLEIV